MTSISSLLDVEALGQHDNHETNKKRQNVGRCGGFVLTVAVTLVLIAFSCWNVDDSEMVTNDDSNHARRDLQSFQGICTGQATPCESVYGPATCTNVGAFTTVCDAVSASCEATCARATLSGYSSPCQCRAEPCVGFSCDYQFLCVGGTPSCGDFSDAVVCSLTHGCRWVPGSGASVEDHSAATVVPPNGYGGRAGQVRAYLIEQNISSEEDLTTAGSPQHLAMDFIVTGTSWPGIGRSYLMEIPEGNLTTRQGYHFMTRYVLAVLYFAMNGHGWVFGLNFLAPTGVCEWYSQLQYADQNPERRGVACNSNTSEVTQLLLKQNNLQGALPTELALVTSLNTIDMDSNGVLGAIPESFQGLTNLANAFFGANKMTGTLPDWIDTLLRLRSINLSNNLFSGTVPRSIANMKELTGVALDNNILTGRIDGVFNIANATGLRKLEQFYAENNRFTGTIGDSFLKDLANLTYLDISDNQFVGSVPVHLFDLPSLVVLDLHDNAFVSLPSDFPNNSNLEFLAMQKSSYGNQSIPSSIANLRSLKHLDLSQNAFSGDIPEEIGTLSNLRYLFLAENNFIPMEIPMWVLRLSGLKELSLKSTNRTGTIPDSFGNDLSKLILLDLDNNHLQGTIPSSLGNMRDLSVLLLNRNNLTSEIPNSFSNLVELKLLYLEANAEITGDLGELFCENPMFAITPVIIADCTLCATAFSGCCTQCCEDGEECNPGYHVPDLDPIWQLGYKRIFFTFQREDYFMKEAQDDSTPASTARNP